MEIDNDLKLNLIADVENVCCLDLDEETKEALMRCFEITIGLHELGARKIDMGKHIADFSAEDVNELAQIAKAERGIIIVCGAVPMGRSETPSMDEMEPILIKRLPRLTDIDNGTFYRKHEKGTHFGRKPSKY